MGHSHLIGQSYPAPLEFPIWCYAQPPAIPATRSSGANDWVDTFDNSGQAVLQFNDRDMGYRVANVLYGSDNSFAVGTFVHNDHWMIDMADVSQNRLSGGVLVSPDKQFSFENGRFVVEVDAAPGADGMGGGNRFYEIDISPARDVTGFGVDALYGYGSFGGIGGLGCRLERNDQGGNAASDIFCRERFRMELTRDSIHLFVNGYPAMQIDGLFAQNPNTGADNRPHRGQSARCRREYCRTVSGAELLSRPTEQHLPLRWQRSTARSGNVHAHADRDAHTNRDANADFATGFYGHTNPDANSRQHGNTDGCRPVAGLRCADPHIRRSCQSESPVQRSVSEWRGRLGQR